MIKSRYIDAICIAAVVAAIIIACAFGDRVTGGPKKQGYEDLIFDNTKVHSIDIKMDDWEDFLKNAQQKKYYNCDVTIDGESFYNVALRTKGGSSLEDVKGSKYSLKIEFDHNDSSVTYHGLDKLSLNNMIFDKTYMKDFITYQMMQRIGAVTPLTSYSYVTVNGSDLGLYLNIEGIEDSFLKRNYGADHGALYKPEGGGVEGEEEEGDYEQEELPQIDGIDWETIDWKTFDWDSLSDEQMMQLEEFFAMDEAEDEAGDAECLKYIDDKISSYPAIFDMAKTKVNKADKKRLIHSIKVLNSGKNISSAVDTENVMKYFVVHNFVSNDDGYTSSLVHNYYLYEKNGQMSMIPWDYNLAFGTMVTHDEDYVINQSIDTLLTGEDVSTRPMFAWIVNDELYKEQYHRYYGQFIREQIDSGEINRFIDDTAKLIAPYIEKDPSKFYAADTFPKGVTAMKKYFELRSQKIKYELAGSDRTVDTTAFRCVDLGTEDF